MSKKLRWDCIIKKRGTKRKERSPSALEDPFSPFLQFLFCRGPQCSALLCSALLFPAAAVSLSYPYPTRSASGPIPPRRADGLPPASDPHSRPKAVLSDTFNKWKVPEIPTHQDQGHFGVQPPLAGQLLRAARARHSGKEAGVPGPGFQTGAARAVGVGKGEAG